MLKQRLRRASALLLLVLPMLGGTAASADDRTPTVIELFTSQGCNSCPPADALLGEMVKRDGVLALTFNVDYWDYLGWKDTLASPEYTDRQRQYARSMHSRSVYTPQVVIGGRTHVVGSSRRDIDRAIAVDQGLPEPRLDVHVQGQGDKVTVAIDGKSPVGNAAVWLVRFARQKDVPIERGENAGNKLSYYNVVRDIRQIGEWHGKPMEFELAKASLAGDDIDGCAVLVQENTHGPIIGAGMLAWSGS